ncbi:SIR2 family protein [Rhizobium leguminosarum]|uniref:SIR2 family protein n=1 Tax=Rhizobium leguminosarum TaxID=384 RepID=UPI0013DAD41D|nr:SIR2 family protein [Rhizobium leguminosarum]NEK38216.1 SIR2 family protein [Rhizobium leguminosarum]
MPTAGSITVQETLDLLDGAFASVKKGVAEGSYSFWLGSGISRGRVIGLDGVIAKLIEFLRSNITADANCRFRTALDSIVKMAGLTPEQRAEIDISAPAANWACLQAMVSTLWDKYSEVLSLDIPGEDLDFLLWVGLDFPNTFSGQKADAEHLALAMLALEGAVSEIATANWDGLIEAALEELGHSSNFLQITVDGEDLRGPQAAARLYKFHGCARRAIEDEQTYRKMLIARDPQIVDWMTNQTFAIVREQLVALIQRSRTLMIGLSAQDANIKHLFGRVGAIKGWDWNSTPTPIVFAADELSQGQKTVLNVAYGDNYGPNRDAIAQAALFRAYGKQILLSLLLSVIVEKLKTMALDAAAPNLTDGHRQAVADGLVHLRNKVATSSEVDRLAAAQMIAATIGRAKFQLQNGESEPGKRPYFPLDKQPVHLMAGDVASAVTGQREAANALGLIGLDDRDGIWHASVDDPTQPNSGALRLTSATATTRIFFTANDDNITSLLECGAFDESDPDVVVVCSRRVSARQQRNPSANFRTGVVGPRYIAFGPLLQRADGIDALREEFRSEIAI